MKQLSWILGLGFFAAASSFALEPERDPYLLRHDGVSRLYRLHLRSEVAGNCPEQHLDFEIKRRNDTSESLELLRDGVCRESTDRRLARERSPTVCLSYGKSTGLVYLDPARFQVPLDGVYVLRLPRGFEMWGVTRFR
jgi:hypothetical protein